MVVDPIYLKPYRRWRDIWFRLGYNSIDSKDARIAFYSTRRIDPYTYPFNALDVSNIGLSSYRKLEFILAMLNDILFAEEIDFASLKNFQSLELRSYQSEDPIYLCNFFSVRNEETKTYFPIPERIETFQEIVLQTIQTKALFEETINELTMLSLNQSEKRAEQFKNIFDKNQEHIINFDSALTTIMELVIYPQ